MSCRCLPSAVAQQARNDCMAQLPGVYDSGIVASAQHSADCHRSSHNCACTCGGQESGNYDPRYAHAWDAGHGGDRALAKVIREAFLRDPRTRYVIDNGIIYYPDGSWSHGSGHEDHVHVSFLPGTTWDTRTFTFTTDSGDDAEMLSTDAQKWIDQRLIDADERAKAREAQLRKDIAADIRGVVYGTAKRPSRLVKKLNRLLAAAGLKTED